MASSPADRAQLSTLITEGRAALLAGDKAQARALLEAAVALDAQSEEAWLWLSGTYSAPGEIAACLRRVLALNPDNEQAHEGLRWLAEEYGPDQAAAAPPPALPAAAPAAPSADPAPVAVAAPPPAAPQPRYQSRHGTSTLIEAALHPFAAGALLGLLRLVGWLRPSTLLLLRGGDGPLGLAGGVQVAAAATLLHGLALVLVWALSGWQLSRLRVDGRGDIFDSLVRAGRIWVPGYLWGGALLLAALGLPLSPEPWRSVAVLCWVLLLGGAALIGLRLRRQLAAVGLPAPRRSALARLLAILVVGGVLALGLAGIATAALLR